MFLNPFNKKFSVTSCIGGQFFDFIDKQFDAIL